MNQYNTDKQNSENKIGNDDQKTCGLVTTTVLNTKIGEVENKIPDATGLVTTSIFDKKVLKAENKITDVGGLVKKID